MAATETTCVEKQRTWTPREDAAIRENYRLLGVQGVADILGRSRASVKGRAKRIGATAAGKDYLEWTDAEEAVLRDHYPRLSQRVSELLPGRSAKSISRRASKFGIKFADPRAWTAEEDAIIRELYPSQDVELTGRTEHAIKNRAFRIGVKKTSRRPWSPEEDAILRAKYPLIGSNVSAELGRSRTAVVVRASLIEAKYRGQLRLYCYACKTTTVHIPLMDRLECECNNCGAKRSG